MNKAYYSIEEVAELLNVDYQLIYKLIKNGQLPALKLGRIYRINQHDLDAFIEANMTSARGEASKHVCAACGDVFATLSTLKHTCSVEGCPNRICVDCHSRLKVDKCRDHQTT